MASVWRDFVHKSPGLPDLIDVIASIMTIPLDAAQTQAALDYASIEPAAFNLSRTGDLLKVAYEEHEPHSVWIEVIAGAKKHETLDEIAEAYKFAWGSGAGFREREESHAIFRRSLPAGCRQERRG